MNPKLASRLFAGAAALTCAATPLAAAAPPLVASAALDDAKGQDAGWARIENKGGKPVLTVWLRGLTPGAHGIHLHTVGSCVGPAFTSAGGHLNPGGKQHGKDNPMGMHMGDLPNVTIGADGTGTATVPLGGTAKALFAALFDADGSAIVVHAAADDYKTDPSGNSGARVACGVFRKG